METKAENLITAMRNLVSSIYQTNATIDTPTHNDFKKYHMLRVSEVIGALEVYTLSSFTEDELEEIFTHAKRVTERVPDTQRNG
jgi:hypothetical protein